MHSHRVYADNNAGTFECDASIACRTILEKKRLGNASSPHEEGREAREILEHARETISALSGVPSTGYNVFTSGATESNRLAILGGIGAAQKHRGGQFRVITTNFEHSSVSAVSDAVGRTVINVDPRDGQIPWKKLADEASDGDVSVVAIILAHNELGVVQDSENIARAISMARANRETKTLSPGKQVSADLLFHYDAAQMLGKGPFDLSALGADTAAWSAHKFHGPPGVGGLLMRNEDVIFPTAGCCQVSPHGQEKGFRSGTENVPGCACAAEALRSTIALGKRGMWKEMRRATSSLADSLTTIDGVTINGHPGNPNSLCNTVHISIPIDRYDGVHAVKLLDEEYGIACSTGSACLVSAPSLSLAAIGLPREKIIGGIRLSFSLHSNPLSDTDSLNVALRSLLMK